MGTVLVTASEVNGEVGALVLDTDHEPQLFTVSHLDAPDTIVGAHCEGRFVLPHNALHRVGDGYVQAQGSELVSFDRSLAALDYFSLEAPSAREQTSGFSSGVNSPAGAWFVAPTAGVIAVFDSSSSMFRTARVADASSVEGLIVESCVPEPLLVSGSVLARAGAGLAVVDQKSLEVQQYVPTDRAVFALGSIADSYWTFESGGRVVNRDEALAPTETSATQLDVVAVL
jgi:hypothetical protein